MHKVHESAYTITSTEHHTYNGENKKHGYIDSGALKHYYNGSVWYNNSYSLCTPNWADTGTVQCMNDKTLECLMRKRSLRIKLLKGP